MLLKELGSHEEARSCERCTDEQSRQDTLRGNVARRMELKGASRIPESLIAHIYIKQYLSLSIYMSCMCFYIHTYIHIYIYIYIFIPLIIRILLTASGPFLTIP